jgi:hypothetical protein
VKETLKFGVNQCDHAFGLNVIWLEAVYANNEKGEGTT